MWRQITHSSACPGGWEGSGRVIRAKTGQLRPVGRLSPGWALKGPRRQFVQPLGGQTEACPRSPRSQVVAHVYRPCLHTHRHAHSHTYTPAAKGKSILGPVGWRGRPRPSPVDPVLPSRLILQHQEDNLLEPTAPDHQVLQPKGWHVRVCEHLETLGWRVQPCWYDAQRNGFGALKGVGGGACQMVGLSPAGDHV